MASFFNPLSHTSDNLLNVLITYKSVLGRVPQVILELGRQMWVDQEPKASPHYIESSTTKTHMTWAKLCDLGQTNKPIAGVGPTAVEQATQWCAIDLEPLCSDLASMPCLTQGLLVSSFPAPFGYSWLLPDPIPFQRRLSHSVQILLVPTARLLKKLLCQMIPDNLRLCPPPRSRLKKTGHLGQTSPRSLLKEDTSGNKHVHWDANSHGDGRLCGHIRSTSALLRRQK